MFNDQTLGRSFKGGNWDLRKEDRRQSATEISFPDRRKDERRLTKMHDHYASRMEMLSWVDKSGLDE